MSRLGSDVKAVAAILVGAAAGVAGTVMTLRALDGPSSEAAVACVEVGEPRVVYTHEEGRATVRIAPAPRARARSTCEDVGGAPSVTVIGSGPDARVRVIRFEADRARREAERARRQADQMRRRAEEVRQRAEEVRRRAEEVRVRAERMRLEVEGRGAASAVEAGDMERARREALEQARRLREEYEAVLERYRETVKAAAAAGAAGGGG